MNGSSLSNNGNKIIHHSITDVTSVGYAVDGLLEMRSPSTIYRAVPPRQGYVYRSGISNQRIIRATPGKVVVISNQE